MKYTIEGFQQASLIKLGCDTQDVTFLRWFIDWQNTGEMEEVTDKKTGIVYYWVDLSYCLRQLPILKISCPKSLSRRLRRLAKVNLLRIKRVHKQAQTKLFLAIVPETFKPLVMTGNSNVRCGEPKSPLWTQPHINESPSTGDSNVRCEDKKNGFSQGTQMSANSSIIEEIIPSEDSFLGKETKKSSSKSFQRKKRERKALKAYGEDFQNVYLSDEEYSKLLSRIITKQPNVNGQGEQQLLTRINRMAVWQEMPGKQYYEDHYLALISWHDKDLRDGNLESNSQPHRQMTAAERNIQIIMNS